MALHEGFFFFFFLGGGGGGGGGGEYTKETGVVYSQLKFKFLSPRRM